MFGAAAGAGYFDGWVALEEFFFVVFVLDERGEEALWSATTMKAKLTGL